MNKLTEMQCKNAKPKEKTYKLFDGGGLYLEITTKGSKLWRLKYYYLGKEKRLALGSYPEFSLKEARDRRDNAKRLVADNKDPVQEKRKNREKAKEAENNTFEKIAREWHKLNESDWRPEHAKTIMNRLERDVFPIIGKVPIKKLTHKNLLDMAKGIQERGANELAKRVIQMSRHIFQYAIITGRTERNIAEDLRGLIKAKPKKHYASLDIKELPEFLGALYKNEARLMPLTHLAVQFMMLTFVRTGEMIKAEWDEFDFEEKIWLIPAHRMKIPKDHLVPLSDQAMKILRKIRDLHTNQKYVFPSRDNSRNHMSNNTILMALRRMGYAGQMTGHGFRSLAMSTIMEKLGYRHEVPDRQLAHSKRGDVNKAYGLSEKGVIWFLQKIQRSHKQLPSIAEINSSLIECNFQYEEFKKSYEQFNRSKEYCIRGFLEKYYQSSYSRESANLLNIEKLIEVFEIFFPYTPFPGTYTSVGINIEKSDQVIKALTQCKKSTPFLMLCLSLLSLAQHKDIHLYNPEEVLMEMKKLYPDTSTFPSNYDYLGVGEELFTFYTPAQWSKLDLSLVEKSVDSYIVAEFPLYDNSLVFALLNPDIQDDEFIQYIRKVTREYFEMEEMFE